MIINIDASRACRKNPTGTEYYSRELIKGLTFIDEENKYILYAGLEPPEELKKLPANFSWRIVRFKYLWTMIRFSWEFIFRKRNEVLFVPAHVIPLISPKKTIVTIHDVAYVQHKEAFSRFAQLYHRFALSMARRKAKLVITDSMASKKDIAEIGRIPLEKIKVIPLGYDKNLYYPEKRKKTTKPYIYTIGRIEEKKNILNILKAFKILKENYQIPHQLIFAGRPGYGYQDIKEYWNNLPEEIKRQIQELGYIPINKMASLMRQADIFLFPSFFEGFGMPILDAMASGVPVVTSNVSSCPEVAGDAAIQVDPYNVNEIVKAVLDFVNNQKLKEEYTKKGLEQANKFSWERCARETLAAIREVDDLKIKILGIELDNIYFFEALNKIKEFVESKKPHQITTINPEFIVEASKNAKFKEAITGSELKVCDGFGLKLFYHDIKEKITGIDLTWELLKMSSENSWKVYFLGGEKGTAEAVAKRAKTLYPDLKVIGTSAGEPSISEKEVIEDIANKKPDLLFVAYGSPKQEVFLAQNKNKLKVPAMIGVGGTFDFIADNVARAPKWMRKTGFEWLFRLAKEPKRIKRIVNAVLVFPFLVITKRK